MLMIWSRRDAKHLAAARVTVEIYARAVPMVVEMTPLDHVMGEIRVEQSSAVASRISPARIDDSVRSSRSKRGPKRLGFCMVDRAQCRLMSRVAAAQIVQRPINIQYEFPKL